MKIQLPFCIPCILHSPQDTYLLSILENYPESYEWVMSQFINIQIGMNSLYDAFFPNNFNPHWLFIECPYILRKEIHYDNISNDFENFHSACEFYLNQGYYIFPYLNIKYISHYNNSKEDTDHNPIIYGYDNQKEEIYLADFFIDGIYSIKSCSYYDIDLAFQFLKQVPHYKGCDYIKTLTFIKYVPNAFQLNFNNVRNQIKAFQFGKPSCVEYMYTEAGEKGELCYYGKDCYEMVIQRFPTQRILSLFKAYIILWKKREKFFVEKGVIQDSKTFKDNIEQLYIIANKNISIFLKTKYYQNSHHLLEAQQTLTKNLIVQYKNIQEMIIILNELI